MPSIAIGGPCLSASNTAVAVTPAMAANVSAGEKNS